MKKRLIAAVVGLAAAVSGAHATIFDFTYVTGADSGNTFAGQLDGVLQSDGNTVVVNSILDFVMINGSAGPSLPFVESFDELRSYGTDLDPVVTIDGTFMDLIACTDSGCFAGILFSNGNSDSQAFGSQFSSLTDFGLFEEPFFVANWKVSASQVPEPTTVALFGLGLAGLGAMRRKRLAA